MSLVKKINTHFIGGSWQVKKLYVLALLYSLVVRVFMLKISYTKYEARLGRRGVESSTDFPHEHTEIIKVIRTVVEAVSKHTPWESKCMVQALTAKWLLNRYSIASTIYFGVKKDPENEKGLKAHAWLRVGDMIATGREGVRSFKVVNFYS